MVVWSVVKLDNLMVVMMGTMMVGEMVDLWGRWKVVMKVAMKVAMKVVQTAMMKVF